MAVCKQSLKSLNPITFANSIALVNSTKPYSTGKEEIKAANFAEINAMG